MTRVTWDTKKQAKSFYVSTYRLTGSVIVFLVMLNLILGFGIVYAYLNIPSRSYYSTYGETPPVELTAMDSPNYTSTPLLATETVVDSGARTLLQ